MQSPSSSYTATLPLSVLHLCHKKNSFVDPHASHWPVPPPQPLPSSIVSSGYITSCASHLPHYLQPVLPSKPINHFKPFPCLGVHIWVQNTSLQIVTEQHWLSRPIHTWSSPQRTRSASWKTCKCSLNVMDFLHGLSTNITLLSAQLNQLSTQLVTPPAASPAPVSNFPSIPPAQPPSPSTIEPFVPPPEHLGTCGCFLLKCFLVF